MSAKHICDCGQIYWNVDAMVACASTGHSNALENELSDAMDLLSNSAYEDISYD